MPRIISESPWTWPLWNLFSRVRTQNLIANFVWKEREATSTMSFSTKPRWPMSDRTVLVSDPIIDTFLNCAHDRISGKEIHTLVVSTALELLQTNFNIRAKGFWKFSVKPTPTVQVLKLTLFALWYLTFTSATALPYNSIIRLGKPLRVRL